MIEGLSRAAARHAARLEKGIHVTLPVHFFHAVAVSVLCQLSFSRFRGLLFDGLDGAAMLTNVKFQFAWTWPAPGFFANPLQGLVDIWFNFNAWLSPGYVIPYLLFGEGDVADSAFQVTVYTAHALILFVSILIALRSFEMGWAAAYIAAWATILLSFPVLGGAFIYPILQLQPNLAFTIAESLLLVAAFSHLGRFAGGRRKRIPDWRNVATGLVLLVLSAHYLLNAPTGIFLGIGFFVFLAAGVLFGADNRYELVIKLAGAALVSALLLATGFAEFVLGIFSYTAAKFSSADLQNNRGAWNFVSILFHNAGHGPSGPILAALGIAGLIHGSVFAPRRLQWIACAALAYVGVILAFGAATVFFDFWKGPSPVYMEVLLWPIYAAFAARMILSALTICWNRILSHTSVAAASTRGCNARTVASLAVVPCLLVVASYLLVAPKTGRNYVYPPSRPALVETLKDLVGLTLGGPLRGRVAAFQLQARTGPVSWFDLHVDDYAKMGVTGNDFHTVGLWDFGIPTLLEYAPTLSPTLFTAATRLFARPEDPQFRSVLVLRRINANALAALGVSHVLTDAPAPAPLRLLRTETIDKSQTLYLYEVPGAIRSAASPVRIRKAASFSAALRQLSDLADPLETAVLIDGDPDGADLGRLAPASAVSVRLARGGFDISADSRGQSLLLLPIEFSHCLTFVPEVKREDPPRLIRINALETGLVFAGKLRGRLQYFTGPFNGADCRLKDAQAYSRLAAD